MDKYRAGTIVLFYKQAEICLGIIESVDERRCQVSDETGAVLQLPPERFVLASLQTYLPPETGGLPGFAQELTEVRQLFPAEDSIAKLAATEQSFSFEEACSKLGFADDMTRFALFFILKERDDLFVYKKGIYRARNTEECLQFHQEQDLKMEREVYLGAVSSWLDQHDTISQKGLLPESEKLLSNLELSVQTRLVGELRNLLTEREPRDLAKLLRSHPGKMEAANLEANIQELRILLGDIGRDTDPIAAASGIPVAFKPGLENQVVVAETLRREPATTPDGKPLQAFSIDAAGTPDFDDAISLSPDGRGWLLGVHISDVAARLGCESELFLEAQERVASLYLPGDTIPMLPQSLSGNALSLAAGTERPVLSLYARLDEGLRLINWEFRLDSITMTKNYSYEEYDAEMAASPDFQLLNIARLLNRERLGGETEEKPRYTWNLKVIKGAVSLQRTNNLSPSRFIVEELMILYNRLLASQAMKNGLPLIYRNIASFEESVDEEEVAQGVQAYLSTEGKFHPGVCSDAYLHATSPIRRFTDIVNQAQFEALLERRELPRSKGDLENLILAIEKRLLRLRGIGQRSERYWLLRYLEQSQLGKPLDAILLRRLRQGYLVELTSCEKRLVLHCDDRPPLRVPVKIVVSSVDMEELTVSGDVIL